MVVSSFLLPLAQLLPMIPMKIVYKIRSLAFASLSWSFPSYPSSSFLRMNLKFFLFVLISQQFRVQSLPCTHRIDGRSLWPWHTGTQAKKIASSRLGCRGDDIHIDSGKAISISTEWYWTDILGDMLLNLTDIDIFEISLILILIFFPIYQYQRDISEISARYQWDISEMSATYQWDISEISATYQWDIGLILILINIFSDLADIE